MAVIPAIAYSIWSSSSEALCGLRKAPHQPEENDDDGYVKEIQHDSPRNRQQHHVMPCFG
jgi:hypothetical protein